MNPRLVRAIHRAHDVKAARAFYTAVLGTDELEIVPVPEAAAAAGAPAHWLGAIGVEDVAQTLARLVERGATPLGPIRTDPRGGGALATVRDPGGALLALTTASSTGPTTLRPAVGWIHLDAREAEATFAGYAEVFGWCRTEPLDLGSAGVVQQFAWEAGGPSVGSYADLAARPGRHPHWVLHFQVDAVETAVRAVREHGGVVLADMITPDGVRVAICDDPQDGGFGLRGDP